MPRLVIHDGYTLQGETKETVTDTRGEVVAKGLPIVSFQFRPALPTALASWRYDLRLATSGEEEVKITAKFLCDHLATWDVTNAAGAVMPIRPEVVKNIPEPILTQLVNTVTTWAPKAEETKVNLSSGSESAS
jgi:hypothetical protein